MPTIRSVCGKAWQSLWKCALGHNPPLPQISWIILWQATVYHIGETLLNQYDTLVAAFTLRSFFLRVEYVCGTMHEFLCLCQNTTVHKCHMTCLTDAAEISSHLLFFFCISLHVKLSSAEERVGLSLRWKEMSVSICSKAAHLLQIPHIQIAKEISVGLAEGCWRPVFH